MALANILVGLHRAELSCPQLRADFANRLSLCRVPGELNEQAIRELIAGFVSIDVRHDHFDRASLVKFFNEFRSMILAFESSQRTRGLVARFLRQPLLRFALIAFLHERIHKDTVNVKGLHEGLCGLATKFRQCFELRRYLAIFLGTDNVTDEIKPLRKQSSITQPDSVTSRKLAANTPDFHLEFAVVVPLALESRALEHDVCTEPPPRLIPFAADAVEHSVFEGFFRGPLAVLVPGADNTMPAAIAHGHALTKLTVSIKCFLDGGSHVSHIRFCCTPHLPPPLNTRRSEKQIQSCSPLATNSRGANSTRPHERHCEAPMREARQAAPDWARASAALSSSKNSQFSRGTWPLRRKGYGFVVMSYSAANSIAEVISTKFHRGLQLSCEGRQPSRRPATIPRDENLEAKPRRRRKAQGGTEATTRSILELSDAALQFPVVFIAVQATGRMARQRNYNPVKISERPTPL